METKNELVLHIYNSSKMGINSLKNLLTELKDKENKLKKAIEDELKEYEYFYKETQKILKKQDIELCDNNMMSKMMSKMGIKKEVKRDNSDAKMAQLLTQGLTMGVVEITSKIDTYKDIVDKKHLNLAKEYLKFQEKSIEDLKPYL